MLYTEEKISNGKIMLPNPEGVKKVWPWDDVVNTELYAKDVSWPKISIVTPSFNQGKYIEETIRSVLAQNYPNLEYIIIDGGSTDETVEIIKKYEPWITYWVSEPDRGQSHAINKGLEKCSGDIFNWLNSDDWYMPNSLFEVASTFMQHPNALVVSGYENHIQEDGTLVPCEGTFISSSLEATIEFCQIAQPSTFFRMKTMKEIGPIPDDMHSIMDGEIWLRFLVRYGQSSFMKIRKTLVNFRLHENSKTVLNEVENSFSFERSNIISDLQRYIGLPEELILFWRKNYYNTSKDLFLNRNWYINENIISKKQLRIYFLKKYINHHFQRRKLSKARWGIKQLLQNMSLDYFLIKSTIKLIVKTVSG